MNKYSGDRELNRDISDGFYIITTTSILFSLAGISSLILLWQMATLSIDEHFHVLIFVSISSLVALGLISIFEKKSAKVIELASVLGELEHRASDIKRVAMLLKHHDDENVKILAALGNTQKLIQEYLVRAHDVENKNNALKAQISHIQREAETFMKNTYTDLSNKEEYNDSPDLSQKLKNYTKLLESRLDQLGIRVISPDQLEPFKDNNMIIVDEVETEVEADNNKVMICKKPGFKGPKDSLQKAEVSIYKYKAKEEAKEEAISVETNTSQIQVSDSDITKENSETSVDIGDENNKETSNDE